MRRILHRNMRSRTPKVVWNACIAVGKTNSNASLLVAPTLASELFFNEETSKLLLDIIGSKPNIKARIQAIQALLCYEDIEQLGGPTILPEAWDTIIECFKFKTQFSGSATELNYMETFERGFLELWKTVTTMSMEQRESTEMQSYLNSNSTFRLL